MTAAPSPPQDRAPAHPVAGWRGAQTRLPWTFWVALWTVKVVSLVLLGSLFWAPARAQEVQAVPALTARVIDQTSTLSAAQRDALEAKLAAFEAQAGPQIVVLVVRTTQPEDIAAYAQRVGETWKIGRRDVGDGLLLVVAKEDRRLWIAPAKALEGAVPDLAARQIVRDVITPAFKAGDYAGGIDRGLDALMARLRGEGLPEPDRQGASNRAEGVQGHDLLAFLFLAVPVVGGLISRAVGRKVGSVLTGAGTGTLVAWVTHSLWLGLGAGLVAMIVVGILGINAVMQGLGRGSGRGRGADGPVVFGGGGGSSGGGGFGGFSSGGGGDFGGGGAGGSW